MRRGVDISELFMPASKVSQSRGQSTLLSISTSAARSFCLICGAKPQHQRALICSMACDEKVRLRGHKIMRIPYDHASHKSIVNQFESSWRHTGKKCPAVKHVYLIVSPKLVVDRYEAYRERVEARGNFAATGRSAGNENRRWHGTRRECDLGEDGQTEPCTLPTCSLCKIVRESFDLRFFKGRTGWGRFGRGIYTSSTSSKSDDYACDATAQSSLKSMILAKVVVGRGCKMRYDDTTLTAPPLGYDSVLGEKGARLNYDEVVVYSNEAIRPAYLILYEV